MIKRSSTPGQKKQAASGGENAMTSSSSYAHAYRTNRSVRSWPRSLRIQESRQEQNDVKNNGVGRTLIRNVRDLNSAVNSRLRLLQKNPDKVRAFFQLETDSLRSCRVLANI